MPPRTRVQAPVAEAAWADGMESGSDRHQALDRRPAPIPAARHGDRYFDGLPQDRVSSRSDPGERWPNPGRQPAAGSLSDVDARHHASTVAEVIDPPASLESLP